MPEFLFARDNESAIVAAQVRHAEVLCMISNSNPDRFSPVLLARLAGMFALIGIATGAFDIGYVRSVLFVAGDAPATIHNIQAHQTLFRAGFGAHLLLLLCNVPNEILFFILMRRVNVVIAAVAMGCGLIGTAIEGLDMLNAYVPVQMALDSNAMSTFSAAQLQSTGYFSLQLQNVGLLISFVFYGVDEMLSGSLIFRSRFLPRILGLLLALGGFCYFTDGFVSVLSPSLSVRIYPYIIYPCAPGETLIALWMAVMGLNLVKFRAWTAPAQTC
jgi:hypothetical protein